MTRYIDADDFIDLFYVASAGQDKAFIETVEMVVADTPTADVVEVVRCKDCAHSEPDPLYCYCIEEGEWRIPNFYCSKGERRTEDG